MVPRAHFGPIPIPAASRSVLMSHGFAGCASMARSTFPMYRAQNDFPHWVSVRGVSHLLSRSPSPAGRTRWRTDRASHGSASLHAGADQAPRNLRRPSGDRHRERAVVPRTQGVVGAANGDERDFGRDRQLADGYSAGVGRGCRKCSAACATQTMPLSTALKVTPYGSWRNTELCRVAEVVYH